MNKEENALKDFGQGFNCSKAVLSQFCEELGLNRELALKIACGFGGGMRQREACGAVTGAIIAIGLKYGQSEAGDNSSKEKTYRLVKDFNRRFAGKNGSIICRELLVCDLGSESGREYAQENGLFKKVCPKMISDAVEILEEILRHADE